MSHALEQFGDQTAFVSARELPWHRLGTVVDHTMSAEEAMRLAHLANWNVRKEPVYTRVDGKEIVVPDRHAVVRDNPFTGEPESLGGVVGNVYEPVQNEEQADLLNSIVDESGAHFETAGSIKEGREVFVSMKLPGHMLIGGIDGIDTYLTGSNTHDGSKSLAVMVSPVRPVCQNTLSAAFRSATGIIKIRHTRGQGGAAARAREALDLSFAYVEEFEAEAQKMIQESLSNWEFDRMIASLYPLADDASDLVAGRVKQNRDNVRVLFESSPTSTEIRGTNWGAYQAVTEYLDHFAKIPGASGDKAKDVRAGYILDGKTDGLKVKAFQLLSV